MAWYLLPKSSNVEDDYYYVVKAKNLTALRTLGFRTKFVIKKDEDYDKVVKGINPKKLKVWG